jgi:hypothetical protein
MESIWINVKNAPNALSHDPLIRFGDIPPESFTKSYVVRNAMIPAPYGK